MLEISALFYHTLMRTASGEALAMGDSHQGKLGFRPQGGALVSRPHLVPHLTKIVGVAAGGGHSLFLQVRVRVRVS